MSDSMFRVVRSASPAADSGARLGRLALPGRAPVATPAFFAVTSRGAVPHVTPDNAVRLGLFAGAYLALEDFVERVPAHAQREPAVFATPLAAPSSPAATTTGPPSRLHAFAALPLAAVSVLAPRRHPASAAHLGNGADHISIVTSTGFQKLTLGAYGAAVDVLRPDIAVPLADFTYGRDPAVAATAPAASALVATAVPYPTPKRALRMAERTEDWIESWPGGASAGPGPAIFAPTLPVPYATQWPYLERLAEYVGDGPAEGAGAGAGASENRLESDPAGPHGLAIYDVDLLPDLRADYAATLGRLPRLSLHPAPTPHHMLRHIALGADVLVLPSVNAASEAGLAFCFAWTASDQDASPDSQDASPRALAIDLADPLYKASAAPLAPGCTCDACRVHHRAYLHHLLDAREMLAWTLLQIHNHHVVDRLLDGVRATLAADGAAAFERGRARFQATYAPDFPVGRAVRPRARGYQGAGDGPTERLNKPAWGRLEAVADGDGDGASVAGKKRKSSDGAVPGQGGGSRV